MCMFCVCFQVYLSYNNVSALRTMAARNNWCLSSEKDKVPAELSFRWNCKSDSPLPHAKPDVSCDSLFQVRLYTLEQKSMLSIRVEAEVDVPAHRAFSLLAELSNRPRWDKHYQ